MTILSVAKKNISSNWRHLRFRLFSLFEHIDHSLFLFMALQWAYMTPWLLKSSAISLFVQYNNKADIYSKGESILCYGWIPPLKWPLMRKARISYAWVHCQCSKSSGWLSLRWYLINYGKHPSESHTRISQIMTHNWHQAAKLWNVITHAVSKITTQIYYGRKQWSQENTFTFGVPNLKWLVTSANIQHCQFWFIIYV